MSDTEVNLDFVKSLADDPSILFIDVRELDEIASTGLIPGSINIPLATLDDVLSNLSDFEAKFGKTTPTLQTPVIFSCRSGRRSLAALNKAKHLGFTNVKHYPGGWLGWSEIIKNDN